MSGKRLEPRRAAALPRFAVIGTYSAMRNGSFVQHIAILRKECEVEFGDKVAVWHAAPPIVAGDRTSSMSPNAMHASTAHVVAYLDDLSVGEVQGIETSLADIDANTQQLSVQASEHKARAALEGYQAHYTVHPPVQWVRDTKTGRRRYRKFSCSGFVVECYKGAGIVLIEVEGEILPQVDLQLLSQGYGESILDPKRRNTIGLAGDGPWRILLAGYVLHALARDANEVRETPYCPIDTSAASFA